MFGFLNKKPQAVKQANEDAFRKGFATHIPTEAVEYVMQLWREHPFSFTIAGARQTCLGNYIFRNNRHYISVNGDSNQYSFLITLVHEIAHQRVQIAERAFKRRAMPHGDEWKYHFKTLMAPLLNNFVFPHDILAVLVSHMRNPAASSTKDPALVKVLAGYSPQELETGMFLSEVLNEQVFSFKGRGFKKIQERRTRVLVECVNTKKRYTIPGVAKVELL